MSEDRLDALHAMIRAERERIIELEKKLDALAKLFGDNPQWDAHTGLWL